MEDISLVEYGIYFRSKPELNLFFRSVTLSIPLKFKLESV